VITPGLAIRYSKYCRKLVNKKNLYSQFFNPRATLMALFILDQKKKPTSRWLKYFATFPTDFSEFPTNYTAIEMTWLGNTDLYTQTISKREGIQADFNLVRRYVTRKFS
jgi:hypothetical protein